MIDSKTYQRYAADPAAFRADLIVDVDGVARKFGTVMDGWQRADFAALDLQNPIEEIGLDNPVHATLVELRTSQQRRGVQPLHRQAQHRMRDDLG